MSGASHTYQKALWVALSCFIVAATSAAESERFESASTVEEVRRHIERLPKDQSWWMANGQDMAWNNRNLNRIFATVNVYRDGPVRPLESRPMAEIADYEVDTPDGKVRFADFLRSEKSTSMGLVILHRGKIVFEDYHAWSPTSAPSTGR